MKALADRVRSLPPDVRAAMYERIERELGAGALADIRQDFEGFWGREDQIVDPAELAKFALILFTGPRGAGKTESAVRLFDREIRTGRALRPRIFAANEGDVDKAVVHGESGIMSCYAKNDPAKPIWIKHEGPAGVLRYPNGTEVVCFSAKAPEGAVSHQSDLDLYDDVAKWGPRAATAWQHARISCRLGYAVGILATTRRGIFFLKKLLGGSVDGVLLRRPSDLRANKYNLSAKLFRQMEAEFDGSGFKAQELDDEDVEGLSPFADVDFGAIRIDDLPSDIVACCVSIDPASSTESHSCEVGVVGVAITATGCVIGISDKSDKMDAGVWPGIGWELFDKLEKLAPTFFAVETNTGGNMGPGLLRAEEKIRRLRAGKPGVSIVEIHEVKPLKSKAKRGSIVARLAKQGQLKMMRHMPVVEKQLRELDDTEGPLRDRGDAFVQGALELVDPDKQDDEFSSDEHFAGFAKAQQRIPEPAFGVYRDDDVNDDRYDRV